MWMMKLETTSFPGSLSVASDWGELWERGWTWAGMILVLNGSIDTKKTSLMMCKLLWLQVTETITWS